MKGVGSEGLGSAQTAATGTCGTLDHSFRVSVPSFATSGPCTSQDCLVDIKCKNALNEGWHNLKVLGVLHYPLGLILIRP